MKQIVNFPFNDIVLYSKCWYERSGDVFEDIKKCLEEDNVYNTWPNMTPREICRYMLIALDKLYEHLDEDDKKNGRWLYKHSAFLDQIEHNMKFWDNTYEEAIVYAVLGIFSELSKDEIKLNKPVYGKGRRRMGQMFTDKTSKSMTYKEMNKRASKMFDGQ